MAEGGRVLSSWSKGERVTFSSFDAVTVQLLYRVFDAAMLDLEGSLALSAVRKSATIARITRQLLAAADTGEREAARLKVLALDGIAR
jgi:hypothetical protein